MEKFNPIWLTQLHVCLLVISTLVFYMPDFVRAEIKFNCGPGAVVGQPYKLQCTNLPKIPTNGINVFVGDEVNSIITCLKSKECLSQAPLLYSVVSPHNESLYFTIKNVTRDDVGKRLYCVDATAHNSSSPNCLLSNLTTTTESTTTSMNDNDDGLTGGEIAGIVIGVLVVVVIIVVIAIIYKKKKE